MFCILGVWLLVPQDMKRKELHVWSSQNKILFVGPLQLCMCESEAVEDEWDWSVGLLVWKQFNNLSNFWMTFSIVAQNTHFESTVFGNTEIEFACCVSSFLNNIWWFSSRISRMRGKIPTIYLFLAPFKLCYFHCSSPCIADGTKVKRMVAAKFSSADSF